jgi:hypothetical protein
LSSNCRTGIVQEDTELIGEPRSAAKKVGRGCHLLLHDMIVLLLLCGRLEPSPRKGATKEVHEDIGERLQIITPSLLHTQMGVNGRVAGGFGQIHVLMIGDMKMRLRIAVLLCKTKVNNIDLNVLDTRDLLYTLADGN